LTTGKSTARCKQAVDTDLETEDNRSADIREGSDMRVKESRLAALFAATMAAAAIVAAPMAAADVGEPDNPDIPDCFSVPDSSVSNCATPSDVQIHDAPDVIQPADQPLALDGGDGSADGPTIDVGGGGAFEGGGGHR
jgi:hypothetical protein